MSHKPNEGVKAAAVIFDSDLVKLLNSDDIRIPTNFVGVRRVRPHKLLEEKRNSNTVRNENTVFTVKVANGIGRRMTKQEKKKEKQKMKQKQKEDRKRHRQEQMDSPTSIPSNLKTPSIYSSTTNSRYFQVALNNTALEQELAELRGERNGLPPVLLSPAMAIHAETILWPSSGSGHIEHKLQFTYDHEMSKKWAELLKETMRPAEATREKDNKIRPMPYQLTPEPWTRLRQNMGQQKLESNRDAQHFSSRWDLMPSKCKSTRMICRQPTETDLIASLVFEYLFMESKYYVSCGAKFGCDFLIYDGPREERHAFAGLRILKAKEGQLPIQSAFSLSGFVRCLNTAGKFALLATVVRDEKCENPLYRLAFVDIALEKVLTAPTHKKRARTQKRRDVAKNLAKL
ncbi:unnamed protein product [Cylindrotheca closterium]|uniref:tRNA-intron lyase n=1 Tax=Cylindrotheca closterium TaxID=2856 RepID=A0AAD2CC16_9STRA|nr:unnamed protein product [Cylindrotheca closterium]